MSPGADTVTGSIVPNPAMRKDDPMNTDGSEQRFLRYVQRNPVNRQILELAPSLGLTDWWLTAGALFQTVWNVLDGRHPQAGIRDYDLFYFDEDTSYEAEDAVIQRARDLFQDVDADIEVRNEARVHLWYEEHFGVPAVQFTSVADAIHHFAAKTCCFAVTSDASGSLTTYAPHGYDDLFARRVIPNDVLAPRDVYETKTRRWKKEWPSLWIAPWPPQPVSSSPTTERVTMTTLNPALVTDGTGTYRASVLATPADAARLHGEYIEADDMYRRGGTGRAEWVQFTGSVFIERLGEDGKPVDGDVLLASEFNARFRSAVPVQ